MKKRIFRIVTVMLIVFSLLAVSSGFEVLGKSKPFLKEKKAMIYLDQTDYQVMTEGVTKKAVVRYYSSDKAVLKVGKKNGKVTPLKEGTATVTVKVKQGGKNYKLKAVITVASKQENTGKNVTCAEFSKMMSEVINECDPSLVTKWNKLAKKALKNTSDLKRADAELILYEAACVLGIGKGSAFWCNYQVAYGTELRLRRIANGELFGNFVDISPFECLWNENAGWTYENTSASYSYGNSSPADPDPFFGRIQSEDDYEAVLSAEICETAALRLKKAYECYHEGYFDITDYETDWSDERLKDAYDLKEAILNSETKIVKSDKFVQGETYTGKAYYVSNNGNDANDGLSPETAWASVKKVTETELEYGDAVFFERGGQWYANGLKMQTGVTYSAYGTGKKPVWSGSPLDCGESSNWIYYGETNDGGKIWKYKEKQTDCGIILLNDKIVARKYYPVWNGNEYLTYDGKKKFNLKRDLSVDLMYYSDIDLTGYSVPCSPWDAMIKGDIYFRCDKGNPGDVFDSIEMNVTVDSIATAQDGYNTIDNICYRFVSMDCNCNSNIIYQNCEGCWAGGSIGSFNINGNGQYSTGISGGGMLLFGSNIIGRNNYIHDCENKGIAVVINGDGHHSNMSRKNILVENNVVERCGRSFYMMTEFVAEGKTTVFEDVTVKNNYFINSGSGWRAHNELWVGNGFGTYGDQNSGTNLHTISKTGKVVFKDNLYYDSVGPFIAINVRNETTDKAEFVNNRFIVRKGSLLYDCSKADDDQGNEFVLAIGTTEMIEKELKRKLGKNYVEFLN